MVRIHKKGTNMELIVQLIAGAVGGNVAGGLLKNFNLGMLGNSLAGIVGGGLGGQILGGLMGGGAEAVAGGGMDVGSIIGSLASGGVACVLLIVTPVARDGAAAYQTGECRGLGRSREA